jgi:hypothetical protein
LAGAAGDVEVGAAVGAKAAAAAAEPTMCRCPNDKTSWIASAASAHHDPNRTFRRNQGIDLRTFFGPMKLAPRQQKRIGINLNIL